MVQLIKIVFHIFILYLIYLLGEWIQHTFNLFIPGSVIGMLILFVLLLTKVVRLSWIEEGTSLMLKHLTLFFIPVTVGIINFFDLFKGKGFLLVLIAIISTLLVMLSAGHVSQWMMLRNQSVVPRKETSHE